MKGSWKSRALGLILALGACSEGTAPDLDKPQLVIAGDSTAADYRPDQAPQTGWGQALRYFLANPEQLDNRAVNGRSLRSFADEGKWQDLLDTLRPDDVVLISFGHNDALRDSPQRYSDPETNYPAYLKSYAEAVLSLEAIPIIVSPAPRRLWEGPVMVETHGLYRAAAEVVADELGVAFIDLSRDGLAYFETIGGMETKADFMWISTEDRDPRYPQGLEDNTHFSALGACGVAFVLARKMAVRPELSGFIDEAKLEADTVSGEMKRPEAVLSCARQLGWDF